MCEKKCYSFSYCIFFQDRVKGPTALTPVDKFKKMPRGHSETVVLQDKSQVLTRWQDNATVTLLSSLLGDLPRGTAVRYSRDAKKKVDISQPDVVKAYNEKMGGVDRFDQNQNHIRIKVGGKKWYWPIVTWSLDAAVQNSWQLHRQSGGSLSLVQFKRDYVCSVLRQSAANRNNISAANRGHLSRVGDDNLRFDNIGHYLIVKKDERRQCALTVCKTRCQTYCCKCERALCVYHFHDYHISK